MDAYDVGGWDRYAIAMLGAAGVLVGLIFVALLVNMQQVLRFPWLVTRAGEAILELLEVRRRSDAQIGAGVVALGLFGLAGISLVAGAGGGLYWLLPAPLASPGLATLNAWVLLVEVNR